MMQESARLPARTVDQSFFERLVLAATTVVPNIVLALYDEMEWHLVDPMWDLERLKQILEAL
jgi:hypothetical protein